MNGISIKLNFKNILYLDGVGSSWPRRDIIFIKVLIPKYDKTNIYTNIARNFL